MSETCPECGSGDGSYIVTASGGKEFECGSGVDAAGKHEFTSRACLHRQLAQAKAENEKLQADLAEYKAENESVHGALQDAREAADEAAKERT